jgi:hypothetical protein
LNYETIDHIQLGKNNEKKMKIQKSLAPLPFMKVLYLNDEMSDDNATGCGQHRHQQTM